MILFDLKIKEASLLKGSSKLPVDLLVSSLTKIQTVISCKERASQAELKKEEMIRQLSQIEEKKSFYRKAAEKSLLFLS
jgi:hypothetical protein